jgi:hypothetical protein
MHLGTVERRLHEISDPPKTRVKPRQTLGENIHRIVDLDIHVVTDGRKFIFLRANDFPVLTLDLP